MKLKRNKSPNLKPEKIPPGYTRYLYLVQWRETNDLYEVQHHCQLVYATGAADACRAVIGAVSVRKYLHPTCLEARSLPYDQVLVHGTGWSKT